MKKIHFAILSSLILSVSAIEAQQVNHPNDNDDCICYLLQKKTLSVSYQDFNIDSTHLCINNACKGPDGIYIDFADQIIKTPVDLSDAQLLAEPNGWPRDNMFIRNDTLAISSWTDNGETFADEYFNFNHNKWEIKGHFNRTEINYHFEPQLEDEKYTVYFSNREEGIGYLLFRDKQSQIEYAFKVFQLVRILPLDGNYFLIGRKSINKIADPTKGVTHDGSLYSHLHAPIKSPQEVIYTSPDSITINSGYLSKGEIIYLVNNQKETFLAKIKQGKLIKIFGLSQLYTFQNSSRFNLGYSKNPYQLFIPYSEDKTNQFGVLDIEGDSIHLISIRNKD